MVKGLKGNQIIDDEENTQVMMPQSTDESLWDQSGTNFRRKKLDSVHCAFGEDLQQTATRQRCPLDVGDFKLLFKSGLELCGGGKL